jgi:hypothetical protein
MAMSSATALMTSHNTTNHAAPLKVNGHELCHCTDDVTQHHEPCQNAEGTGYRSSDYFTDQPIEPFGTVFFLL